MIGKPEKRHSVSWLIVCLVVLPGLLTAACGGDLTTEGPGPDGVGPVGPVGPVGGGEEGIPGSGNITSEPRAVDAFDSLVFSGEGTVVLVQGEDVSLVIEADDNLHQYMIADVEDRELTISTAPSTDIAPSESIVFRVGVVDLTVIELAGVGTVTAGTLNTGVAEVVLSGTGDIRIEQLRAADLTVDHRGVGTIRLTGEADRQIVSASGVGEYDGAGLISREAEVRAFGSGEVTVHVTDALEVVVSESGSVAFYGAPQVEQEVSDSGEITSLGER